MTKPVELFSRAEIQALIRQRDILFETMNAILDEAMEREDVRDGSDGRPQPNDWMHVASLCREALGKVEELGDDD